MHAFSRFLGRKRWSRQRRKRRSRSNGFARLFIGKKSRYFRYIDRMPCRVCLNHWRNVQWYVCLLLLLFLGCMLCKWCRHFFGISVCIVITQHTLGVAGFLFVTPYKSNDNNIHTITIITDHPLMIFIYLFSFQGGRGGQGVQVRADFRSEILIVDTIAFRLGPTGRKRR